MALVLAARCADCMPRAWPHDVRLHLKQTACQVCLLRVLELLAHDKVAFARHSLFHTQRLLLRVASVAHC